MAIRVLIAFAVWSLLHPGLGMPQTFSSGTQRVHVIELYTSEGCSSCPPADHWLSQWVARPELWTQLVPLAFHVDYWDYLGWRDPLASAAHSARQRQYQRERGLRAVYTPGFVYDGQEWRRWSAGQMPDFDDRDRVGELSLQVQEASAAARFTPANKGLRRARLHLAILGFELESAVVAGENRGRTLRHNFVVLAMSAANMTRENGAFAARLSLPKAPREAPRMALAAWVTDGSTQAPLQALGGWLGERVRGAGGEAGDGSWHR